MCGLHSVREVKSALSQHSATKRCKCTSWMTLLLRDVDLDQFDHMAAEPTHGPHHSCSSSSWLGASDPFLAIGNLFPYGGSTCLDHRAAPRGDCGDGAGDGHHEAKLLLEARRRANKVRWLWSCGPRWPRRAAQQPACRPAAAGAQPEWRCHPKCLSLPGVGRMTALCIRKDELLLADGGAHREAMRRA